MSTTGNNYPDPLGQPNIPAPVASRGRGLGITALILGIVSFATVWIPFWGYFIIFLAVVAVVLGIIALVQKRGSGQGLIGLIFGAVGLILAIVFSIVWSALFAVASSTDTTAAAQAHEASSAPSVAASAPAKSTPSPASKLYTVTFSGPAGSTATWDSADGSTQQETIPSSGTLIEKIPAQPFIGINANVVSFSGGNAKCTVVTPSGKTYVAGGQATTTMATCPDGLGD